MYMDIGGGGILEAPWTERLKKKGPTGLLEGGVNKTKERCRFGCVR